MVYSSKHSAVRLIARHDKTRVGLGLSECVIMRGSIGYPTTNRWTNRLLLLASPMQPPSKPAKIVYLVANGIHRDASICA